MITIRPNLNQKGYTTVHEGRLGKKLASVQYITIKLLDHVIRPSGLNQVRENGEKTVFCGLIGHKFDFVILPNKSSKQVTFNPVKDSSFQYEGKDLEPNGQYITAFQGRYYIVYN